MTSGAETLLEAQLQSYGMSYAREVTFISGRRFRADFLVGPGGSNVIVEVEGGTWVEGRHSRGKGFESDCEKQALAVIAGYRYLRVTSNQVEDGRAIDWIRQCLRR